MFKKTGRGQVLLIFAVALVALLAFVGIVVDSAHYAQEMIHARNALDTACLRAAFANAHGGSAVIAFQGSLAENGIPQNGYTPNVGSGTDLIKGLEYNDRSIRTAVSFNVSTTLMSLVGINEMTIHAREQCTSLGVYIAPIAVKAAAWHDSYHNKLPVDVLGQGSQADEDAGKSYRGAVFPFIWCITSLNNPIPNKDCPYPLALSPLTKTPGDAQAAKNVLMTCWIGNCDRVLAPYMTRVAIVSGVSDQQLCKSASSAGLVPGQTFVAMIYDGTVQTPTAGYGGWENVQVLGYATFRVTELLPSDGNCNEMKAVATSGLEQYPMDIPGFRPRQVPWESIGGF